MNQYLEWISLVPIIFILPMLPGVNKLFKEVQPQKLSYGAATSGILLTFYGIWIGLLDFNVTNIEDSIPSLLEGLKTAFSSSIVGLTTSMVINLFFVKQDNEEDFTNIADSLNSLEVSLREFSMNSAELQSQALLGTLKKLLEELEMGVNTETKETMIKFRDSVDFLSKWQEKYVDEIKVVTEAMDKNAVVTQATSEQLDRTNDVLEQLGPVTEKIAESIGWVQKALPSSRPKTRFPPDEK